ncbi:hypothetical protein HPG69_005556 [Diceros bicornis minor]|uniref:Uncharacterized protein n=1 Tax=Diceros bicornis minor TaxID=77932 RepID=A0A7J7EM95_DICBM|nr:hypothetical protein HPG69_005556 [Diceros bicornis minor]
MDSQVLIKLFPTSLALHLLPHITTSACLSPLSDPRAEMTVHAINQKLRSQLTRSEQGFRDLMEKFLVSQATTKSLANELQKYNQEQQLTYLRHMLQEGRDALALRHQHLNDLLTHDDPDDCQRQGFSEQLAEGCRLAKALPTCSAQVPGSQETPHLPSKCFHKLSWFPHHTWGHDRNRTDWVGVERRNVQGGGHAAPSVCSLPDAV